MNRILAITLMLFPLPAFACQPNTPAVGITECNYERFSAWVSCEDKGNLMSWFELSADTGSDDTSSRNYKTDDDPALVNCQQTTDDTYGGDYHVGHLAGAVDKRRVLENFSWDSFPVPAVHNLFIFSIF